ncbi:DNA helicase II [bacterium HR28]|nr:DNA helicase II [bacterium HR28]
MCSEYTLAASQTFLNSFTVLSRANQERLIRKLPELRADPHPDGTDHKRRLEKYHDVYRLRVGNYRVFYRIRDDCVVVLLGVEHRKDAYRQESLAFDDPLTLIIEPDPGDLLPSATGQNEPFPSFDQGSPEISSTRPLARLLTEPDLARLNVPRERWPALLSCQTEEQLLELLQTFPPSLAERLIDLACGKTLDDTLDDPVYVLGPDLSLPDLLQGNTQLCYLLDQSQEKALERIRSSPGPYLITGAPGTGKTVLALLAVSALRERAQASGHEDPRVLFVTFTRTLAQTLTRLAERHLPPADRLSLTVDTLDRLVADLTPDVEMARDEQVRILLRQARSRAFDRPLSPDPRRDRALASLLRRITDLYLRTEIDEVILGRGLASLEDYLKADRTGRQVGLNATQREAVWRVYEALSDLLREQELYLLEERRQLALDILRQNPDHQRYDAVIVDEVHDLSLVALRLVRELCRDPGALVFVGDVGQSVYLRGARWELLRDELPNCQQISLSTNQRSTPEIFAAAKAYLQAIPMRGTADHHPPLDHRKQAARRQPLVVLLPVWDAWGQALPKVLAEQLAVLRLTPSHAAILVPTNDLAQEVASALGTAGFPSEVVTRGQSLSASPSVKVLTWHNAKGLEFPLVVVLMPDWQPPPVGWSDIETDEIREVVALWRRAAYVAMTRAIRALVVLRPAEGTSPLLAGFEAPEWQKTTWENGAAAGDPAAPVLAF